MGAHIANAHMMSEACGIETLGYEPAGLTVHLPPE